MNIETLKLYQAWRRDDESLEHKTMDELGLTPQNIGLAIDYAITQCEQAESLRNEIDLLQKENTDQKNQICTLLDALEWVCNVYLVDDQSPDREADKKRAVLMVMAQVAKAGSV